MANLKIGIIGSGGMARHHLERFSTMSTAEVVAIASRNAQTGGQLAAQYNTAFVPEWTNLMTRDDIDGVVICTHNDSHGEIVLAALQADKHVFVEYPLASDVGEGEAALRLARERGRVLRVSHPEVVSNKHQALKQKIGELGELYLTNFVRFTPGRGARPEILFNLQVSGTPAHFFIYHIYPIVDCFGGAAWVEGSAIYEGLMENGQYQQFINTLTVEFKRGGIGQWTWAGGITTHSVVQDECYVLSEGTLTYDGDDWYGFGHDGLIVLSVSDSPQPTLQELWLSEIHNAAHQPPCLKDAEVALESIRISLGAAQAVNGRFYL